MRSLIRRRISTVSAECAVTATEIHWLGTGPYIVLHLSSHVTTSSVVALHLMAGLRAFEYVLRRKHAFYKPLLPVLERLLSRPTYKALDQRLGPTTDPRCSPDFQQMIY